MRQTSIFGTIPEDWPVCEQDGCDEPAIARRLCPRHYYDHRARNGGRALRKWANLSDPIELKRTKETK